MTGIDVDIETHAPTAVITLAGEIDLATCPDVRAAAVVALNSSQISEIVIDLAAVTFLDSTAIGCFLDLKKVTTNRNIALRLRGLQPGPARVFDITGLTAVFDLGSTEADAGRC
jgi:anti-anti-sigma factor